MKEKKPSLKVREKGAARTDGTPKQKGGRKRKGRRARDSGGREGWELGERKIKMRRGRV